MQMEGIIAKGQLVPLTFTQHNVAASQAAAAMNLIESETGADVITFLGVTELQLPFDFDVVGISVVSNAAVTAGSITADATINGNVTGLQAVLSTTAATRAYKRQAREADRGVAGGRVGVKLTTTADLAPTTADIAVTVWVLAYLDQV